MEERKTAPSAAKTAFVPELSALLGRESAALARLTAAARREQAALEFGGGPALDRSLNEQTSLQMELRALEQERLRLLKAAGAPGATLSELAGRAPGEPGQRLRELLGTLRGQVSTLRRCNDQNSRMIRRKLREKAAPLPGVYTPAVGKSAEQPAGKPAGAVLPARRMDAKA